MTQSQNVDVTAGDVALDGDLSLPSEPKGIVVFAHGSGSSRRSPRNRGVAAFLNEQGLATLLFDLLTEAEGVIDAETRALRFDIPLLGRRTIGAVDWIHQKDETRGLGVGLFGSSTGAAAALIAAAERPDVVRAVVSRGGRPDLADEHLGAVRAPTLLLVGGKDETVIELNEAARGRMTSGVCALQIVPDASHLFEEPGKLDEVQRRAADWFLEHL